MKSSQFVLQVQARRRPVDPGSRLVPMINIVFLLLIFFLVAGQIQARHGLDLRPPQADVMVEPPSKPARLMLDRNLNLFLDRESITLAGLREQVEMIRPAEGDSLILEIDRDVTAGDLDELLKVLRQAGIEAVRLTIQIRAGA